jgi:hypothetical protein
MTIKINANLGTIALSIYLILEGYFFRFGLSG